MPRPPASPLLERDAELARLTAAVEGLADDRTGGAIVVQGPPGIGKTSLLRAVGASAEEQGVRVLRARGAELERGFAYGVVRQLLEPVWFAAAADERERWASGAAALAVPLLEELDGVTAEADDASGFRRVHGLYWLCANLAGERPLLLVVDDLQWADEASAVFLGFLARRLAGLPVVLLLGARPPDPTTHPEALALISDPSAEHLRPRPLTEGAVTAWMQERLGAEVDPAFAGACHEVTSGNPLLVTELLHEVAAEGLAPTREGAERVRRLGPAAVSSAVMLRLARLPDAAAQLARTVAVLGDGASLAVAAQLAGLDEYEAAAIAAALARADVLGGGDELSFVHPVVRAAIYDNLPAIERQRRHAAAAAVLRERGARPEVVAAHLLHAPAGTVGEALDTLARAAHEALARGAPGAAVDYLRRALDESPDAPARMGLLHELGQAERLRDGAAAIEHMEEALALARDPDDRARIALDLGWTIVYTEGDERAVRLLDATERSVAGAQPDLRDRLRAGLLTIAVMEPALRPLADERLAEVRARPLEELDGPGAHTLAAILAWADGRAGGDRAEAVARARAAVRGLPREDEVSSGWLYALLTLTAADELDEAIAAWDVALDHARSRGSLLGVASACCMRAYARLARGDVPAAEADAVEALEAIDAGAIGIGRPWAVAFLARAQGERGDLAAAERTLDDARIAVAGNSAHRAPLREARAWLLLARGRFAEAAAELEQAGADFTAAGGVNPAWLPWRSGMARALAGSEPDMAVRFAAEETALARRWGAPRALGRALRVEGSVRGGADGEALLREAVAVLDGAPAALEHARALLALGAHLRRDNRRREAREPLHAAHELARRCGALRLEEEIRTELQASGLRARPAEGGGVASLSPSERRVVELAAAGRTNRDIAQALFVTEKTVETHLRNAYMKLGIRSRRELPASLAA